MAETHELEALHRALERQDLDALRAVLASPNITPDDTALTTAVTWHWEDGIRALLDHGAKVSDGLMALAIGTSACSVIDLLAKRCTDPEVIDSSLRYATEYLCTDAVRTLIPYCRDINAVLYEADAGSTLVHMAARYGSVDCLQALCGAGASATARNRYDETPLHFALIVPSHQFQHNSGKPLECVRFLVGHGADMNAVCVRGATPVFYAIDHDYPDVVEFFSDADADIVGLVNSHIELLLSAATSMSMMDKLLQYPDINVCDEEFSVLPSAVTRGTLPAVRALLAYDPFEFDEVADLADAVVRSPRGGMMLPLLATSFDEEELCLETMGVFLRGDKPCRDPPGIIAYCLPRVDARGSFEDETLMRMAAVNNRPRILRSLLRRAQPAASENEMRILLSAALMHSCLPVCELLWEMQPALRPTAHALQLVCRSTKEEEAPSMLDLVLRTSPRWHGEDTAALVRDALLPNAAIRSAAEPVLLLLDAVQGDPIQHDAVFHDACIHGAVLAVEVLLHHPKFHVPDSVVEDAAIAAQHGGGHPSIAQLLRRHQAANKE